MTDHTHTVVTKRHVRSGAHPAEETDQPKVVYEAGDPITPTESELASFPYRFEAVEGDTTSDDDEADTTDESDDSVDLESMDYGELQTLAADYDEIKGNWSADRLRAELDAVVNE